MTSQLHRFTQASLLQTFARPFVDLGGQIADVIDRCRLPHEALEDPGLLIDADATYRAIDLMAKELNDPYFGAKIAREAARQGVSMLRQSGAETRMLCDFLLRATLEVESQFTNVRYKLDIDATTTSFIIKRQFRPRAPLDQVDAAGVVFYAEIIRMAVGNDFKGSDLTVTVTSSDGFPPKYLPRAQITSTSFNGQMLRFPTHWLLYELVLEWRPAETRKHSLTNIKKRGSTLRVLEDLAEIHLGRSDLNLKVMAGLCGINPRNLQRELARHDTSFRELIDGVKQRKAAKLLLTTEVSINEIAFAVGFSGAEAFSRAFRRWTGLSPSAYRSRSVGKKEEAAGQLSDCF